MAVESIQYIYKRGLYNNYTKDINPKEEPIRSLGFIVMWLFDSNRYDIKIHTEGKLPYIVLKQNDKRTTIASFQTDEGDIIMNIFPKPGKEILGPRTIVIEEDNKSYFIDAFWDTVSDYTLDIAAYLNAPFLGRSALEEELYQQELEMDRILYQKEIDTIYEESKRTFSK